MYPTSFDLTVHCQADEAPLLTRLRTREHCQGYTAKDRMVCILLFACRLLACMYTISTMKAPAMASCIFLSRKPPKLLRHRPGICVPLSQHSSAGRNPGQTIMLSPSLFSVILGYRALLFILEVQRKRWENKERPASARVKGLRCRYSSRCLNRALELRKA